MLTRLTRLVPALPLLIAALIATAAGQEPPPEQPKPGQGKSEPGKGRFGKKGKWLPGAEEAMAKLKEQEVPAQPVTIITDLDEVNPEYALIGEYVGDIVVGSKEHFKLGVHVCYAGPKFFHFQSYLGGLPGEGWDDRLDSRRGNGRFDGETLMLTSKPGPVTFMVKDGQLEALLKGTRIGWARKVERTSPTLGQAPPEGALTLFDGSSLDRLSGGEVVDDGWLVGPFASQELFQDHLLHLEFRVPYVPDVGPHARGLNRVMIQGRYELQIRDSLSLRPVKRTCGYIVGAENALVNMSYPPLTWQTFDIHFRAARFDASGEQLEPARATIFHNGVLIHDGTELPETSPLGLDPGPEPGPLVISGDGFPVAYRNIWVNSLEP